MRVRRPALHWLTLTPSRDRQLIRALSVDGYWVSCSALSQMRAQSVIDASPAVVVMVVDFPKKRARQFLSAIRQQGHRGSVMVITQALAVPQGITLLDAGADDWLVQPVPEALLLARLRALQRRWWAFSDPSIVHGSLTISPQWHTVSLAGQPVMLTRRECHVLRLLMNQCGKVISKGRLLRALTSLDSDRSACSQNTLEVHIHRLRQKLGADLIQTIRGEGYQIDVSEVTPTAGQTNRTRPPGFLPPPLADPQPPVVPRPITQTPAMSNR